MPLTITSIMRHAERCHGDREVVSVTADQPLHRYTYRDCFARARRLAGALTGLGMQAGDRVATIAWNDYRHLEAYYAIGCAGAVCHTINPRLFDEQITFIVNHARDRWILTDVAFVPKLEQLAHTFTGVEGFIILTDEAHMPDTSLPNAMCYERLLAGAAPEFDWPELDENAACGLCYTSGTTGNPKGVLYSHRANVLHAYGCALPDSLGLRARDVLLPVVPMFHANSWGVTYAAPMVGAKLVLPGPKLADGKLLCDLVESEAVTISAGVPTVWLALLEYLRDSGRTLASMTRTVIGGSACPLTMMEEFRDRHGVTVLHAWGMTESSPLGTINTPMPGDEALDAGARAERMLKQGRPVPGVELKIVDDSGAELPWDGVAFGALKMRGPWVCSGYYELDAASEAHAEAGWFETGDVATIDPDGYVRLTDRTKDVIKSGGEWISSIDLENAAVGHPAIAEAAVIGVAHPKWQERPLLVCVLRQGEQVDAAGVLEFLQDKVASWWLPDAVVFVDELPHTATGKLSKLTLRQQFADYSLPDVG